MGLQMFIKRLCKKIKEKLLFILMYYSKLFNWFFPPLLFSTSVFKLVCSRQSCLSAWTNFCKQYKKPTVYKGTLLRVNCFCCWKRSTWFSEGSKRWFKKVFVVQMLQRSLNAVLLDFFCKYRLLFKFCKKMLRPRFQTTSMGTQWVFSSRLPNRPHNFATRLFSESEG